MLFFYWKSFDSAVTINYRDNQINILHLEIMTDKSGLRNYLCRSFSQNVNITSAKWKI